MIKYESFDEWLEQYRNLSDSDIRGSAYPIVRKAFEAGREFFKSGTTRLEQQILEKAKAGEFKGLETIARELEQLLRMVQIILILNHLEQKESTISLKQFLGAL